MAKYAVLRQKVRQLNEACLFQAQEEMRGFLKNISAVVTYFLRVKLFGAFPSVFLEAWTSNRHALSSRIPFLWRLARHRLAHPFPELGNVFSPVGFRGECQGLFLESKTNPDHLLAFLYRLPFVAQRGVGLDIRMGFVQDSATKFSKICLGSLGSGEKFMEGVQLHFHSPVGFPRG